MAGEATGVPALLRRGGDGLAHDDGDPVGAALGGVLRLVGGRRGQEGAGLLLVAVVVVGGERTSYARMSPRGGG